MENIAVEHKDLRRVIRKVLAENQETFFYQAPITVGSINNTRINGDNMEVDFATDKHVPMRFSCPAKAYDTWSQTADDDSVQAFMIQFFDGAKAEDEQDIQSDDTLDEIVDDSGNLMGNQDTPSNSTNAGIGIGATSDSERTIPQTFGKSTRYYGGMGMGIVVW